MDALPRLLALGVLPRGLLTKAQVQLWQVFRL